MFIKNGTIYKSKRAGLKVKVTGIKVEFEVATESGATLPGTGQSIEMWKFRKDFEDLDPAAEYTQPPKTKTASTQRVEKKENEDGTTGNATTEGVQS